MSKSDKAIIRSKRKDALKMVNRMNKAKGRKAQLARDMILGKNAVTIYSGLPAKITHGFKRVCNEQIHY